MPQPLITEDNGELQYDVKKVCKAIAFSETGNCTDGTALKRKNCHGIMRFWIDKDGNRQRAPAYFDSHEESFKTCESIWSKSYGSLPNYKLAHKWSGGDNVDSWLKNFYIAYRKL